MAAYVHLHRLSVVQQVCLCSVQHYIYLEAEYVSVQVRRCMELLGRFQYHVIGGATGSGKGKLLDCLRDHGGQVI